MTAEQQSIQSKLAHLCAGQDVFNIYSPVSGSIGTVSLQPFTETSFFVDRPCGNTVEVDFTDLVNVGRKSVFVDISLPDSTELPCGVPPTGGKHDSVLLTV